MSLRNVCIYPQFPLASWILQFTHFVVVRLLYSSAITSEHIFLWMCRFLFTVAAGIRILLVCVFQMFSSGRTKGIFFLPLTSILPVHGSISFLIHFPGMPFYVCKACKCLPATPSTRPGKCNVCVCVWVQHFCCAFIWAWATFCSYAVFLMRTVL